jgi:hypothetical protein
MTTSAASRVHAPPRFAASPADLDPNTDRQLTANAEANQVRRAELGVVPCDERYDTRVTADCW